MPFLRKTFCSVLLSTCLGVAAQAGPYKAAADRLAAGLPARAKVAVLPFLYIGGPENSRGGQVLTERLTAELAGVKKLRLLERALLDKVLGELKLDAAGLAGEAVLREAGRLLAADFVVVGSLYRDNAGRLEFNARAVETATGRIAAAAAAAGVPADWLEGLPSFPGGRMPEIAVFKFCWSGLRALDRGENGASAEKFSLALKEDGTGACGLDTPGLAWRGRAQARLNLGDSRGALEDLAAGLKAAPGSADLLSARAGAYLSLGRIAEALKDHDALVKAAPGDPGRWLRRGMVQAVFGDGEAAVRDLTRALELGAGDPMAYTARGAMLLFFGKFAEAGKDLDKAVSLDPELAEAYLTRGMLYGRQGRFKEALQAYDVLVELEPWRPQSYLERGICLGAMHRFERALADFNKALELNGDYAEGYCARASLLRTRLRNDEALADLEKALELKPDYGKAFAVRASLYLDLGRNKEAAADLGRAIELERPPRPERYFDRAMAWGRMGEFRQAIEDLDRYIAEVPDNPAAYEARGYSHERLGRPDKARADRKKIKELMMKKVRPETAGAGGGK